MRHLALALVLLGCSADPVIAPRDCTPGTTTTCACPGASGVQTCTAAGTVGACVCADAGMDAQAAPGDAVDAPLSAVDVAVTDVSDAPPRDVADAAAHDAGRCPAGTRAMCDGRTVNLQSGELDGGIRYHCGACGHACGVGEFCIQCVCTR